MKKSIEPRAIAVGFLLAITVLCWVSMTTYWGTHRLVRSIDTLGEGHQALETLQSIELMMESAESSVRGYVITGDPNRLDAYHQARRVVPDKLQDVETLILAQPHGKKTFARLKRLLSSHLVYLSNIVAQREANGFDAAVQFIAAEDDNSNRDAMEELLVDLQQDERAQLKQHGTHTAENTLQTNAAIVLAAACSFVLIVWVFGLLRREVKVRRQAESRTERTERFLQSIVQRIPYMILVKEVENLRLTFVNKAAEDWLGHTEEELLLSNAFDLRPREEALEAIRGDREVLQQGRPVDIPEESLNLPGKEQRFLHTQKIPVPDDDGNPAFLLTISEDVTQRKQAERMLEMSRDTAVESARLKAEFIRNMSHEIRTPLSIVIGMTDLLLDTELSADQRRFAATVKRAADGLLVLSKGILDFSKIEAGSFALETREVNVREIVEGVVTMVKDQAAAKGVNVASLIYQDIPPVVRGDPARLRQVLTQLIGNAVKFTPKGEVIVRVTETKQTDSQIWLNCRISDTGIGIAPDKQEEIFQPFRQGDGSHTRRFGGTGLGLAISKRIIELMGGEIGFETTEGKGSTFWCTIPFNKRHVHGPVIQMASPHWARARVLLIDENETFRQLLQEQLSTWVLATESVSSGQTALELLRREQKAGRAFPIVITDMHLPDMDGVALAKAIRDDKSLAGTKLLVMTSPESPMDAATAGELGFSGWISKPPKPDELYERLVTLINPQDVQNEHAA